MRQPMIASSVWFVRVTRLRLAGAAGLARLWAGARGRWRDVGGATFGQVAGAALFGRGLALAFGMIRSFQRGTDMNAYCITAITWRARRRVLRRRRWLWQRRGARLSHGTYGRDKGWPAARQRAWQRFQRLPPAAHRCAGTTAPRRCRWPARRPRLGTRRA